MFRYQNFFETLKGCSRKCFGTVTQNFFDGKTLYSPSPFLIHKLFHKRKVSETQHRKVAQRKVTVLWERTTSTEIRDKRPLSYPSQYSIPEIFWYTGGFLAKTFRHCETKKNSSEKIETPPSFSSINFFANGRKHSAEGFLSEMLWSSEKKQIWQKIEIAAFFLILNMFRYRNWWNIKGFISEIFGAEIKIFHGKFDTPPPSYP